MAAAPVTKFAHGSLDLCEASHRRGRVHHVSASVAERVCIRRAGTAGTAWNAHWPCHVRVLPAAIRPATAAVTSMVSPSFMAARCCVILPPWRTHYSSSVAHTSATHKRYMACALLCRRAHAKRPCRHHSLAVRCRQARVHVATCMMHADSRQQLPGSCGMHLT